MDPSVRQTQPAIVRACPGHVLRLTPPAPPPEEISPLKGCPGLLGSVGRRGRVRCQRQRVRLADRLRLLVTCGTRCEEEWEASAPATSRLALYAAPPRPGPAGHCVLGRRHAFCVRVASTPRSATQYWLHATEQPCVALEPERVTAPSYLPRSTALCGGWRGPIARAGQGEAGFQHGGRAGAASHGEGPAAPRGRGGSMATLQRGANRPRALVGGHAVEAASSSAQAARDGGRRALHDRRGARALSLIHI